MGFTGSYFLSLLFYVSVINVIRQPAVMCLNEEGTQQCIPKRMFMELIRLPEFSSGIAAYLRTTRIGQRTKGYNDIDHLKVQFSATGNDDAEVCIPASVYLELLRDPALRGYLSVMARTQKLSELPAGLPNNSGEGSDPREAEKRSLATLAKNDDLPLLPITTQEGENDGDDEEKRSDSSSDNVEALVRLLLDKEGRRLPEMYDYPAAELDPELAELDKRNVGSLARDFALPTGRRHIASVVRDYGSPNGKRNIGALARQNTLPLGGGNKRNVAALARDASLPYGKRYLGSLLRSGGYPVRGYDDDGNDEKRSIASLARNADWPAFAKRGGTAAAGRIITRVLSRPGRSLNDDREVHNEPLDLQRLIIGQNVDHEARNDDVPVWRAIPRVSQDGTNLDGTKTRNRRIDATSQTRHKRQVDGFSDEYPLPVLQNTNMLEYEDMVETFADRYPQKRFMGSAPETLPADPAGYPEVLRTSKRHIGALARLGWLPSFRAPRFSRSPRYLVDRENPADGPTSNYTPDSSTRSLRPMFALKTRLQSLHGDCRHGFERFLLLPDADNLLRAPNSRLVSSRIM